MSRNLLFDCGVNIIAILGKNYNDELWALLCPLETLSTSGTQLLK
jgi:hypothetical protein